MNFKRHLITILELSGHLKEQCQADWPLRRLSHRGSFMEHGFLYCPAAGEAAEIYVFESGANLEHREIVGRAVCAFSFKNDGCRDLSGHGTHVVASIAGKLVGAAKKAIINVIKIGDDGVDADGYIGGLRWLNRHLRERPCPGPAPIVLINTDVTGEITVEGLVSGLMAAGALVVVAAADDEADACSYTPKAHDYLVVGGVDIKNCLWELSDWGECVDIFGPAMYMSAGVDSVTDYTVFCGTCMAAAHVTGVLACLSVELGVDAATLKKLFLMTATKNIIGNLPPGTPNRLAYYPAFEIAVFRFLFDLVYRLEVLEQTQHPFDLD